jgi:anthranilate synthase/aminodeoxychorismate synthase-like glutamine amidotransferase
VITEFFSQTLPSLNFDFYLIVSELTTIAFAVIFFALIFKILPDVIAPWRDILIGALATTVLFMLGKYLIGLYLTTSGISAAYRAAGSLIIFIVWVYYNIQTILLGAIFTQVYTEMYGGKIVRPGKVMHGKLSPIYHSERGVFSKLPSPFTATRYHSLVVDNKTLPDCLEVTAWTQLEDGSTDEIMGLRHKTLAVEGVQFHPESILSEHGHRLLKNFLQN